MTVNAIHISQHGVAHATDSRITHLDDSNNRVVSKEAGRPKIIKVPRFLGALSWFGTVKVKDWDALTWLEEQAAKANDFKRDQVDDFAANLAHQMGEQIYNRSYLSREPLGIGAHFTFFDSVEGKEIPELIFISNFQSITTLGAYKTETPVIQALRQTFHTISGSKDVSYKEHSQKDYRLIVDDYLKVVGPLAYQNGDNILYNASSAMTELIVAQLVVRNALDSLDNLRLAGRKVLLRTEIVAKAQELFCSANHQLVGSPCYNLMIDPQGKYHSDTGLA